jgi:hypothetical protein
MNVIKENREHRYFRTFGWTFCFDARFSVAPWRFSRYGPVGAWHRALIYFHNRRVVTTRVALDVLCFTG